MRADQKMPGLILLYVGNTDGVDSDFAPAGRKLWL
jgi:hypothetical protein